MKNVNTLTLKWGTLKGYDFSGNKKAKELLKEYHDIGACMSVMLQKDTDRQKEIILELIDLCNDPDGICLDWTGKFVTKEQAKEYIKTYGVDK